MSLVDSGADSSCVPWDVAVGLGIRFDPSQPKTGSGAGGPYSYYEALQDLRIRTEAGPVVLVRPLVIPGLTQVLLGRRDFFASYAIQFVRQVILLQPAAAYRG